MDWFEFYFECFVMLFGIIVFIVGFPLTVAFLLAAMNSSIAIR